MADHPSMKRRSSDQDFEDHLQKYIIAKKKAKTEDLNGLGAFSQGKFGQGPSALNRNMKDAYVLRINPLHLELPTSNLQNAHFDHHELNSRLNRHSSREEMTLSEEFGGRAPFFLQNMSYVDDDNEPRKLFTLYDIKNDETSKSALEAKRRLRFTNVNLLICPQEKMFLTTACDYFQAIYDELIDYVEAIGELRNKQIIVDHSYYKLYMHTLKMFYYTDKGWRFVVEFDEFFSGYMRKYKEPIVNQMTTNWNNAKKAARDAARQQAARRAALEVEAEEV